MEAETTEALRRQLEEERLLRQSYEHAVHDLETQLEKHRLQKKVTSGGIKGMSMWHLFLNPLVCSHCRKIAAENSSLKSEISRLKKELDHSYGIVAKMVDSISPQIEEGAQSFYTKESASQEIEELTAALFEEANRMVAYEKRLRAELEKSKLQLSKELSEAMEVIQSGLKFQVSRLSKSISFDDTATGPVVQTRAVLEGEE